MKAKNVIEINGKLYDAHSGKPISSIPKKQPVKPTRVAANKQKVVDGIKRPTTQKSTNHAAAKQTPKKQHTPAPQLKTRTQKSQTLHRKGVKRPDLTSTKATTPTHVRPKQDVSQRLERAMQVSKSSIVSKFGTIKADVTKPTKQVVAGTQKADSTTKIVPTPIKKTAVTNTSKATISDDDTKKPRSIKHHVSKASIVVGIFSTIAIVGYLLYLNVPVVSLKIASYRAGVSASLPSYKPIGFNVHAPARHEPGVVIINFASTTSAREFSVEQRASTWDSNALKDDINRQTGEDPLVYQNQGLTVFIYGDQAAWINSGKLYTLNTKGSQVATDQILKLAASM